MVTGTEVVPATGRMTDNSKWCKPLSVVTGEVRALLNLLLNRAVSNSKRLYIINISKKYKDGRP